MRRAGLFALCALWLGIPASAKPPKPGLGSHPEADEHFEAGEFRLAARAYRRAVDENPEDFLGIFGIARSRAALDDCTEPLELLEKLRRTPAWSAEMAVLEGACRASVGDISGAVVAYEETLELGGEPWKVLPRLAEARLVAGDVDGFEEAVATLSEIDGTVEIVAVLRAREAVELGLFDVDVRLQEARRLVREGPVGEKDADLDVLDARVWLDADEPGLARAILVPAVGLRLTDPTLAAWSLESGRRDGEDAAVVSGMDRAGIKRAKGVLLEAVRARILVDIGKLDEAAAKLDALSPDHPEVVASRWYLARARGDEAQMRWCEARWALLAPGWSLDALVPTWRRR